MSLLHKLARDPLLHFLAAGGLLFAVFRAVHGPQTAAPVDDRTIEVDRASLVKHMQNRAMAFKPGFFDAQFAALPAQEKRELIDEYVREEALVREATAMGLAEGDYVIRRRVAQKMLYLIDDTAAASISPTTAEIEAYFNANQDRYRVAPTFTFTHVFVDNEIRRAEGAERVAHRLLRELDLRQATFADASAYGDRFPYSKNFVRRSADFIENQLGPQFTSALRSLSPSNQWQGPLQSEYGYHLVLLTERQDAYVPNLADIQEQVRDDLLRERVEKYREAALEDLTQRFTVKLTGIDLEGENARVSQATQPEGRVER